MGFSAHIPLTTAGDIIIVPTPGHSDGHISLLVRDAGTDYLIAGDVTYSETAFLLRDYQGLPTRPQAFESTFDALYNTYRQAPFVYLPSHDPASVARLKNRTLAAL